MRKTLLLTFVMFFTMALNSQQISSMVLINKENHLTTGTDPHYRMQTESNKGLSLQFTLDQLTIGNWPVGFGIGYHRFSGNFFITGGGLGCVTNLDMTYQKQLISLTVYPLCISHKNFNLKAGIEGTSLLNETVKGEKEVWIKDNGSTTYPIEKTPGSSTNSIILG